MIEFISVDNFLPEQVKDEKVSGKLVLEIEASGITTCDVGTYDFGKDDFSSPVLNNCLDARVVRWESIYE